MNTKRSAFTLVELLIVIMIIGILAGASLAALQAAQDSAAKARTRATIAKLNGFVMEKYASYQYRRTGNSGDSASDRLSKIRRLQRCEMPDHWDDVDNTYSPASIVNASNRTHGDNASAELLYLIVMDMEGADLAFSGAEIGDTDGNGLSEFLDGWGRPIQFLRWPAGHCEGNFGAISNIQTGNDADPFDVRNVDKNSYAVFPLIFSMGPDGARGILMSQNSNSPCGNKECGAPGEGNPDTAKETSMYFDNITNHNME